MLLLRFPGPRTAPLMRFASTNLGGRVDLVESRSRIIRREALGACAPARAESMKLDRIVSVVR
jgi:hypothetical protein